MGLSQYFDYELKKVCVKWVPVPLYKKYKDSLPKDNTTCDRQNIWF